MTTKVHFHLHGPIYQRNRLTPRYPWVNSLRVWPLTFFWSSGEYAPGEVIPVSAYVRSQSEPTEDWVAEHAAAEHAEYVRRGQLAIFDYFLGREVDPPASMWNK